MYNSLIVADNIKKLCEAKKTTQTELLHSCNIGRNAISHMTHGSMPKCDTLAKIADFLGCSLDYLLGREIIPRAIDTPPNNYIIAYFDILGSSNIIEYDACAKLMHAMNDIYNNMVNVFETENKLYEDLHFQTKTFSDNILVYVPFKDEKSRNIIASALAASLQYMQFHAFYAYGLILRGGMVLGKLYVNEVFALGPALLSAHDLENKSGSPPRIIVHNSLVDSILCIDNSCQKIKQDSDGRYYINYIGVLGDPDVSPEHCSRFEKMLTKHINLYKENKKVCSKYIWILDKLNNFLNEHSRSTVNYPAPFNSVSVGQNIQVGVVPNQSNSVSTNSGTIGVIGNANAPVTIQNGHARELTKQEQDLLRIYNNVNGKTQMKIMNFLYEIKDETERNDL